MATTVWRSTRSIGRPIPRSATSDSVATSSASDTGRSESEGTTSFSRTCPDKQATAQPDGTHVAGSGNAQMNPL